MNETQPYRREMQCWHCGQPFAVTSKRGGSRKYCSEACARAARAKRQHELYAKNGVRRSPAEEARRAAYTGIHDIDDGYLALAAAVLREISKEYEYALEAYLNEHFGLEQMLERAQVLRQEERCLAQETEYLSALSLGAMDAKALISAMRVQYGVEQMDLEAEIRYMRLKLARERSS